MAKACEITRAEFATKAAPVRITFTMPNGHTRDLLLDAKEFSTGSMGWGVDPMDAKITVCVDGRDVKCQLSLSLTAIGSKELPKV